MASIAMVSTVAFAVTAAAPAVAGGVSFSSSSCLRMASSSVNAFPPLRVNSRRGFSFVMKVVPDEATKELDKISDMIDEAVHDAEIVCQGDDQGECVALWEQVEELSAARAHKKVQFENLKDPLEKYCESNPEADECRTYEE